MMKPRRDELKFLIHITIAVSCAVLIAGGCKTHPYADQREQLSASAQWHGYTFHETSVQAMIEQEEAALHRSVFALGRLLMLHPDDEDMRALVREEIRLMKSISQRFVESDKRIFGMLIGNHDRLFLYTHDDGDDLDRGIIVARNGRVIIQLSEFYGPLVEEQVWYDITDAAGPMLIRRPGEDADPPGPPAPAP